MIDSFHSLLYAAQPTGLFSEEDLRLIETLKDFPARHIFPELRMEIRRKLDELDWRKKWEEVVISSEKTGLWTVSRFCPDYPESLRVLSRPPFLLSVRGEAVWKKRRLFTVVGTRHPGRSSLKWMSFNLGGFLKKKGFTVVSGGARGVDQWAHRVSLAAGQGTLAVVPSGLLNLYPNSLGDMEDEILREGGALISIYPVREPMKKFFFHQRNHLLAALGESTLMVEAGIKSGSLITAQHAYEFGKTVMCLPFSPWDERGAGNNLFLQRDHTALITSENDLIESLEKQLSFRFP